MLPAIFAADPERLARFNREARTLRQIVETLEAGHEQSPATQLGVVIGPADHVVEGNTRFAIGLAAKFEGR